MNSVRDYLTNIKHACVMYTLFIFTTLTYYILI